MATKPVNFRLSPSALAALAHLSTKWQTTKTAAVERSLLMASGQNGIPAAAKRHPLDDVFGSLPASEAALLRKNAALFSPLTPFVKSKS